MNLLGPIMQPVLVFPNLVIKTSPEQSFGFFLKIFGLISQSSWIHFIFALHIMDKK